MVTGLVSEGACRLIDSVSFNGNQLNIYHLTAEETPIVPSKFSYTVSGDNMGGYIVTVDRSGATAN